MMNWRVCLVFLVIFVNYSYGQQLSNFHNYGKKKHHHHHGLHYYHFLHYLTFLAIKLKIFFFLGTIFTISVVAGKIIAIIKLSDYMKKKNNNEEKVVYVSHHDHQDYHSKGYPSDFSMDQPPPDAAYSHERYSVVPNRFQLAQSKSLREEQNDSLLYNTFKTVTDQIRGLNITDMALKEMGLINENCKKKFVCKAEVDASSSSLLRSGLNFLR
ncbi:hypothetical protein ABEB36_007165 [Hypothenemus hampei]|uniref:Uncharacterized protein n=1 Tax=Hypothenemus hampei TaxID=57062 RepID=A0ABD1ETK8_HYPHA